MTTPVFRFILRLILLQTICGLLGIIIAMVLGQPLSQGVIAYTGATNLSENNTDIYVVDVGTEIIYNLTQSPFADRDPIWSVDGAQIAYISHRDGRHIVYIMDAYGRNPQLVRGASTDGWISSIAWSPDGRYLAYIHTQLPTIDIRLLDRQTDTIYRLTSEEIEDHSPVWSPDGTMLAFLGGEWVESEAGQEVRYSVYVLDIAYIDNLEVGLRRVVDFSRNFGPMDWSPDSRYLAIPIFGGDIMTADVPADEMTILPRNHSGRNIQPAWSPDGTTLAFIQNLDGDSDIQLLDIVSGETHPLTDQPADVSFPVWSPDGRMLAYVSRQDNQNRIYVIDIEGGEPRYLAPVLLSSDSALSWRPG